MPLTLYPTIPIFNKPKKEPLENIVGKGENAGNQIKRSKFRKQFLKRVTQGTFL